MPGKPGPSYDSFCPGFSLEHSFSFFFFFPPSFLCCRHENSPIASTYSRGTENNKLWLQHLLKVTVPGILSHILRTKYWCLPSLNGAGLRSSRRQGQEQGCCPGEHWTRGNAEFWSRVSWSTQCLFTDKSLHVTFQKHRLTFWHGKKNELDEQALFKCSTPVHLFTF